MHTGLLMTATTKPVYTACNMLVSGGKGTPSPRPPRRHQGDGHMSNLAQSKFDDASRIFLTSSFFGLVESGAGDKSCFPTSNIMC